MPRPQRKLSRLDWFVLAGLIGAAVFLLYRMFFNLNYNWNWGIIPTYLLRFDAERQRWVQEIAKINRRLSEPAR